MRLQPADARELVVEVKLEDMPNKNIAYAHPLYGEVVECEYPR